MKNIDVGTPETTENIKWLAERMSRFGSETGSERNINYKQSEEVDRLKDEINILRDELMCARSKPAETRIKEMIDERQRIIDKHELGV